MAVKAEDLTKDYKYGFSDPEQYSFKVAARARP